MMKKCGIIVNPIAGMGGRVGLKGTDGPEILKESKRRGALPQAHNRLAQTLENLKALQDKVQFFTCANQMGENIMKSCGFSPVIVGNKNNVNSTAKDTELGAGCMVDQRVDLLLFAGGDGTARDIYHAVDTNQLVLGIPAGVKIHSAVYAISPGRAGELATLVLRDQPVRQVEAEVMDIDEEKYRQEIISTKLYGYLTIPFEKRYVQSLKAGSPPDEKCTQQAIALDIVDKMDNAYHYILGPGTTTRAINEELSLDNSLIGIDLIHKKKLLGKDLSEDQLLKKIKDKSARLIITPIGRQGFLFGRGNQQLSSSVIKQLGAENIVVIATHHKIHSLEGQPLLVDTGCKQTDQTLSGYIKIVTGYGERIVYRVTCA